MSKWTVLYNAWGNSSGEQGAHTVYNRGNSTGEQGHKHTLRELLINDQGAQKPGDSC
jgi:hypothetical protein